MLVLFRSLASDQNGGIPVEFTLILAIIAVASISAVQAIGGKTS